MFSTLANVMTLALLVHASLHDKVRATLSYQHAIINPCHWSACAIAASLDPMQVMQQAYAVF